MHTKINILEFIYKIKKVPNGVCTHVKCCMACSLQLVIMDTKASLNSKDIFKEQLEFREFFI